MTQANKHCIYQQISTHRSVDAMVQSNSGNNRTEAGATDVVPVQLISWRPYSWDRWRWPHRWRPPRPAVPSWPPSPPAPSCPCATPSNQTATASVPANRDRISDRIRGRPNQAGNNGEIKKTHLSRRCSGVRPSEDPLPLGFRAAARSRSFSLWLPRADTGVKDGSDREQETEFTQGTDNRSNKQEIITGKLCRSNRGREGYESSCRSSDSPCSRRIILGDDTKNPPPLVRLFLFLSLGRLVF
jgi:hypothetical protein